MLYPRKNIKCNKNKDVVKHTTLYIIKNGCVVRICKNCKVEQAVGSKAKKCWRCGERVDIFNRDIIV